MPERSPIKDRLVAAGRWLGRCVPVPVWVLLLLVVTWVTLVLCWYAQSQILGRLIHGS